MGNLKIVTYDEIDPEQAMLIDQVCFGTPWSPDRVKLIRQLDARCSDYFGLYALDEQGRAVSQVVVLHIDTKTIEGQEKVAGIAGVGTLPCHSRRGLSTALMKRAHELTHERGMRISILLTSASLVAYEMYLKLGYSTLATFCRGYRRLGSKPRKNLRLRLRKFSLRDAPSLDAAFACQTKDALGFVYRQKGFGTMKVKTQQVSAERIKVAVSSNRIVGYVRTDIEADGVMIDELVGMDHPTRRMMLDEVERQPKSRWALCYGVCDSTTSQLFESHGFRMYRPGWGRVMAAAVDRSLTSEDIAKLYGIDQNRFVIYPMDTF